VFTGMLAVLKLQTNVRGAMGAMHIDNLESRCWGIVDYNTDCRWNLVGSWIGNLEYPATRFAVEGVGWLSGHVLCS